MKKPIDINMSQLIKILQLMRTGDRIVVGNGSALVKQGDGGFKEEEDTRADEPVKKADYSYDDLVGMLEDVVNELDLSESMLEKHGPMGSPPAQMVREVLDKKDLHIRMLKQGFVDVGDKSKSEPVSVEERLPEVGKRVLVFSLLSEEWHRAYLTEHKVAFAVDGIGLVGKSQIPKWLPMPPAQKE